MPTLAKFNADLMPAKPEPTMITSKSKSGSAEGRETNKYYLICSMAEPHQMDAVRDRSDLANQKHIHRHYADVMSPELPINNKS